MKTTYLFAFALFESSLVACTACSPRPGARLAHSGSDAIPSPSEAALARNDGEPGGTSSFTQRAESKRFIAATHPPHGATTPVSVDWSRLPQLSQQQCYFRAPQELYSPTPQQRPIPYGTRSAPKAATSKRGADPFSGSAGRAASEGGGIGNLGGAAPAAAPPAPAKRERRAADDKDRAPGDGANQRNESESARKSESTREAEPMRPLADAPADDYHAWGGQIYLSNDDSMSLSSAQRIIHAIDNYLPLPAEHIRPHELLNYFSFEGAEVRPENDFSVVGSVDEKPGEPGSFTLGLSVSGRAVTRENRRNTALSLVLDRSGSMAQDQRMTYLKSGLNSMLGELKSGDLINLVLFDDQVCVPLSNFVVGRDSIEILRSAIAQIQPRGSTDLEAGLRRGYELANLSHQPGLSNRVLLITDALTNTGVTDPATISAISEAYDRRQVRLSAIGVGRDFNDHLLDQLTEKGRGAYVFLGSAAEVDAVFRGRFTSLIETVANDVHFKLSLPPSLRMNTFYGEESSTVKEDVQAVHYFAGTNQLFLSDLVARDGVLQPSDSLMFSVEYRDPETDRSRVEQYVLGMGELANQAYTVKKGRLIMSFVDGLRDIASHTPDRIGYGPAQWQDSVATEQCARGKESLQEQARQLPADPEVTRVLGLWDKFCARYPVAVIRAPEPQPPIRRPAPTGRDVWPSAQR